jgi:hypothetical protein
MYLGPVRSRVLFQLLNDSRLTSIGVKAVGARYVNAQVRAGVAPQDIVHLYQSNIAPQPSSLDRRTHPGYAGPNYQDVGLHNMIVSWASLRHDISFPLPGPSMRPTRCARQGPRGMCGPFWLFARAVLCYTDSSDEETRRGVVYPYGCTQPARMCAIRTVGASL